MADEFTHWVCAGCGYCIGCDSSYEKSPPYCEVPGTRHEWYPTEEEHR